MEATLPTVTARDADLPGGITVWVQTANALHREQARDAADISASREARPYRKGGEGHTSLIEQFEDGGAELQSGFLADAGYIDGSYQQSAETKFPMPEPPTRKEGETDEGFDKRVAAYDIAAGKVGAKRESHVTGRYEAVKAEAEALIEADRIERCCMVAYQRKRREAFGTRFILELLAKSVRQADNHALPVYASADVIADLPDDLRDALVTAYFSADTVSPAAVPTSVA